MPYLKVQSNQAIAPDTTTAFLQHASRLVAEQLGKPEHYVMVEMQPPTPMLFAGNADPAVYMELKSIGLPTAKTPAISAALCQLVTNQLAIPADRVYIEFANASGNLWGWNGATF